MSTIQVVGTGSSGNTYLLTCGAETLVIDCGIRFLDVKKAMRFQIRGIVGAITTHAHGDHSKYAHEYEKSGIEVWKPYLDSTLIQAKKMGGFTIKSFPCIHDVPCVGYLIEHPAIGKLLYVTDTEYVKYHFRGLSVMLIETNYDDRLVDRNEAKYRHVLTGHMSLQTAAECIEANLGDEMRNIILCHLSENNADPEVCRKEISAIVPPGIAVDVATPGLSINIWR